MDGVSIVIGVLIGLMLVWALFIAILWLVRPRDVGLRQIVGLIPDVLFLITDLLAERATPRGPRLALLGLLVWLISPIDLIPEFIPVLGPLDDVVVAVLVLRYVRRRLGADELRRRWRGSAEGYELLARVIGA